MPLILSVLSLSVNNPFEGFGKPRGLARVDLKRTLVAPNQTRKTLRQLEDPVDSRSG
jgi:hypothetical protein